MKTSLALSVMGLFLLAAPSWAQQTTEAVKRAPYPLEQAAERMRDLELTEEQAFGLMDILMRELPNVLDPNADPGKMASRVSPNVKGLLQPGQLQMLQMIDSETTGLREFGSMGKEERRRLMQGGLQRLNHADAKEWLRRIDSYDF